MLWRGMQAAENLSPAVVQSLAKQLRQLVSSSLDGIRYVHGEGSLTEIVADIDGPEETPFVGGTFRVRLVIGPEYPSKPPKGFFDTRIFHPNVSPSGDICVNTLKRDWKPSTGLAHVLQVIRCLLIVPFPESSLNDEAGKLFMESYDEYFRRAQLMTSIHARPRSCAASGGGGASEREPSAADASAEGPSSPTRRHPSGRAGDGSDAVDSPAAAGAGDGRPLTETEQTEPAPAMAKPASGRAKPTGGERPKKKPKKALKRL